MKKRGVAVGTAVAVAILSLFVFSGCNSGNPTLTVKEKSQIVNPGDYFDLINMIEIEGKGAYTTEFSVIHGDEEVCALDQDGKLYILDGGQQAMNTIDIECTVTGKGNQTVSDRITFNVQNPIGENNSYEVTCSSVRFRVYNNLEDRGNGVFARGNGMADNDYEVEFHASDSAGDLDSLETEIKKYAKDKYFMEEKDYVSEDVVLSSGEKARKITFPTIRQEGKFLSSDNSGLFVRVVIYAFDNDNGCFFIEGNNSWYSEYEMEQIANTVK